MRAACLVVLCTAPQVHARDTTRAAAPAGPTTTLEEVLCGDANDDGNITAGDALFALRAAVGSATCSLAVCDYNGDSKVAASDALSILRKAVGQDVTSNCPLLPTTPLTWDEGTWGEVLWN